jgi:hypothetical protein
MVALRLARLGVWLEVMVALAVVVCDTEGQPVGDGTGVEEQAAGGAMTTPRHCCLLPSDATAALHVLVLGV